MNNNIEIKDLYYKYLNTESTTLNNINLDIKQGECIVLCGKSGSGKTTLTRVLNGLSPNFFRGELKGECSKFGLMAGKSQIEDLKELILAEKAKGTTIVMAEHRLEWTLDFADRYFYFENGAIKKEWNKQEFSKLSSNDFKDRGLRSSNLDNIKMIVEEKKKLSSDLDSTSLIEVKDLTIGYKKDAVYNINKFNISKGEIVGIMGKNSVGKSNFVKTLCGILKPISGEIKYNKKRINRKQLLKKSFMVMQDVNYQLFSDSVKDEVLLGIENPVDYENILDMLGLLEYKDRHHMSLSGGQK